MVIMPKAFPIEFRRDVVAVARTGEAPLSQIAKDFGISESCLHRWLKLADIDDGVRPGVTAGENRVARLCSQQRIWSAFSKKRGLTRKAGPPVHDDRVPRQFTAEGPDRTWLTDITEHPTGEGKLYLCAIKDIYSNRIVGYSMDGRMIAGLAVSALRNAIALRSPAGTVVVHSDRGSQGGFNRCCVHRLNPPSSGPPRSPRPCAPTA
jgi:transposase InsO family protein